MALKAFEYFHLLALVQLVISALLIAASGALLKCRAWGRTVVEVLNWALLLYALSFGTYWIYMWTSLTSAAQAPGRGTPPPGFQAFGVIAGIINIVVFAVPLGLSIYYLRSKTVREACTAV